MIGFGWSSSVYLVFSFPSKTPSVEKYINFEFTLEQASEISFVTSTCKISASFGLVSQRSTLGWAAVWITTLGLIVDIKLRIFFLSSKRSIFVAFPF